MTTKHKLRTTIPCGDPDEGAEQECEITFTYYQGRMAHMSAEWKGGYPHPDEPDEIEFFSATRLVDGKPAPFDEHDPEQPMQAQLDVLAEDWLAGGEGTAEAYATVRDDDDYAREMAAELRADR